MVKTNKLDDDKFSDDEQENIQDIIGLGKFSARKSYYPELQKIIEQLKEEKNKYQRIFSSALSGIFQAKLTGEIIVANPAIIKLCAYDSENDFLSLKDIHESLFISPFELNKLIVRLKKNKSILGFETQFKRKDNVILDVSLNATLQTTKDYEFIEYFVQDITEQKKNEEELVKLSRAIKQSPIGISVTNPMGIIEYINPKFTEMTGYTQEEAMGKKPSILKSGKHTQEFYKTLWDTVLSGNDWQGELLNKKKNGELYWENQIISPIVNEIGEIVKLVSHREDISEKKKMVEDLVAAKEKAEKSDKIKSEFLAQISHEIRTPLNSVMSYTTLLRDEFNFGDSEVLEDIFSSISNSVTRIIRTIDLILNASELQADSYDLNPRMIDIYNDIVVKAFNELKHTASDKNIELRIENNTDNVVLISDEYSVYQTVINLVDNAIKYTDKGWIAIRLLRNPQNKLQLEVEDSGIGISHDFMNHLYDAFSQEEAGYTRRFDGTGLGLSLVKKYCELNRINLDVESKKGVGTKFTLTFI